MNAVTVWRPQLDTIYPMSAELFLTALPDDCIDMAITSPPYDNLRTYSGFTWDFEYIAQQTFRVLKPGGVLVWVVGDATIDGSETLTSFRQALYFRDVCGFRMHDTMIWEKGGGMPHQPYIRYCSVFEYMFVLSKGTPKTTNILTYPKTNVKQKRSRRRRDGTMRVDVSGCGGGAYPNVWLIHTGLNMTTTDVEAFDHPAMFPEKLAEDHILSWSNPGDTVLDFFMGSGTTAKMARKHKRHYLGCDLNPEYVRLAQRRLMTHIQRLNDDNKEATYDDLPLFAQGELA